MSEWGDLKADIRHINQKSDLGDTTEEQQEDTLKTEETTPDSDTEPLDGVGRLIAQWGSWREYKGRK